MLRVPGNEHAEIVSVGACEHGHACDTLSYYSHFVSCLPVAYI